MDLSKLSTKTANEAGVAMPLRHPGTNAVLIDEGSKEPITITVVGKDSDEYTNAARKSMNDRLDNSVNAGTRLKLSSEVLEEEQIKVLVAVTKGWSHIRIGDQEVQFSPATAADLYRDYQFIREQVDAFINNRGNFLGN